MPASALEMQHSFEQSLQSRLTIRLSLRWASEPPSESTDTIVITVGEWYVDLRVDKQSGKIDWALAGQCLLKSKNPRRVVFTHDIDSHHNFNVSNPCPFIPLPNGDDLETGTMARPDRPGAPKTDYEEMWRYLPFRKGPDGPRCGISWVLESEPEEGHLGDGQHRVPKVFLGRIWGTYLAFHQDQVHVVSQTRLGNRDVKISGGEVSALREEWGDGHWERKYALGPNTRALPSMLRGIDGKSQESSWHAGAKVTVGGGWYVVRAFEHAASRATTVFSRL